MEITVLTYGERIDLIMQAEEESIGCRWTMHEKQAEKLHSDLEVALRELDELRLKRQAEAEKYMEEG